MSHQMAKISTVELICKKSGFFSKKKWSLRTIHENNISSRLGAGIVKDGHFLMWVNFCQTPLPHNFSANRKKLNFAENQKRQKCVFGHFLTSDVTLVLDCFAAFSIWLIALMKLFSLGRLVSAPPAKFVPCGIALVEVTKGWLWECCARKENGMVHWTAPGPSVGRTASRVATLDTRVAELLLYTFRCRVVVVDVDLYMYIYIYRYIYISIYTHDRLIGGTDSFEKFSRLLTHSINLMIFLLRVCAPRSVRIACEPLPTYGTL